MAISKAIAMLDAVMSPEWLYRYYSFNSKWNPGQQMASMRDGSGSDYFILFTEHGAILKGFDRGSAAADHVREYGKPLSGMFDGIPSEFDDFLKEPAFSINETTFCYWRRYQDPEWLRGRLPMPAMANPSRADDLLSILRGDANRYAEWAREYYEVPVVLDAVRRVYMQEVLSKHLVDILNSQITLDALQADIDEIGYPGWKPA